MQRRSGPSEHLSWDELSCHDVLRTPYPLDWRNDRAEALAMEFECLRALLGSVPLLVVSAYRTVEWNRFVGGKVHSQHVQGRALDLVPARPNDLDDLYQAARSRAKTGTIRGIGRYPSFIHIDIRPTKELVLWTPTSA